MCSSVPSHHRRAWARARHRRSSSKGRQGTVKLILHLNDFTWQVAPNQYGSTLAEIAWAAEAAGFERIGVADHVWQAPPAGGPAVPEPECYTTMAFLAPHTRRGELMAVVTGVHFPNPDLLAQMVTTLDVLSGGRMLLGIRAG